MAAADIRKEMPPVKLSREEFETRYRERFADPAYAGLKRELDAVTAAAWDAYSHSRKSPATRRAGEGFHDPEYEIALDWLAAREAILQAQLAHDDNNRPPSILLINGSPRSEHTCPGEPYAVSHRALDRDRAFLQEVENAARALGNAVKLARAGKLETPDRDLADPNPK
jgi:hypothetical protein